MKSTIKWTMRIILLPSFVLLALFTLLFMMIHLALTGEMRKFNSEEQAQISLVKVI